MHYRAGEDSMTAERWAEAVLEFKQAIKLDPLLALAHYDLGQAYMALKRYRDAINSYLGARQAFREIATLEQTDRVKADQERDDQIQELRQLLIRWQHAGSDLMQLKIQAQIDSLELTGKKGFERGLETPAEVSMALGSAYYRFGAIPDAEREYLAAIKVKPGFGEAHNNLAVVYMQTGRFDEATTEIRLAEKPGFKVNPKLKEDLEQRLKGN
jgi:Flp pilus assembly protein TadD